MELVLNYLRQKARALKTSLSDADHIIRRSPLTEALAHPSGHYRIIHVQTSKEAFRSLLVDANVKKKDNGFEFMSLHLLSPAFQLSVSKKVKLQVNVVETIKSGGDHQGANLPKWDFYLPVDDDTAEDVQFLDPLRHEKLYSLMKRRLFFLKVLCWNSPPACAQFEPCLGRVASRPQRSSRTMQRRF